MPADKFLVLFFAISKPLSPTSLWKLYDGIYTSSTYQMTKMPWESFSLFYWDDYKYLHIDTAPLLGHVSNF
jgi:hypothetical protein